jgi:ABC-type Zn uptake system ZnuABC Zn-binding protein ZnuA
MVRARRWLAVWLGVWFCGFAAGRLEAAPPLRVLCTTFPVYQLTRPVVAGRERLTLELLLPAALGCPHDYALTPQDLRRLARADVLVVNGLGFEEFLEARAVRDVNPRVTVVEATAGIGGLLHYEEAAGSGPGAPPHGDEEHAAGDLNPHLFASPRQAARLVLAIAAGLGQADPEAAGLYLRNAQAQAERLNRLADAFAALVPTLRNRRIVTQHGVFDYLARDAGLEVVAVVQAEAGQDPSAAEMLLLLRTIRERGAGALFTEPQYPPQVGRAIAGDAGIPLAVLDPVASGPADASPDYYERTMRRNLETLRSTLGAR